MTTLQARQLGTDGPLDVPLGLGCMGMTNLDGPADENEARVSFHDGATR